MDDNNEQISQQGLDDAKRVVKRMAEPVKRGAIRLGKKAGKAAVKLGIKAAQAFLHAVKALLVAIGPWGCLALAVILLFSAVFNWQQDERGSSGQLSQDLRNENPTSVVDGVNIASALTEPQALIDAYYKYLACDSHRKLFVDPDTGEEVWLQFSNADETSDFAGLSDPYSKENYFYLSSYFIKMTDELLHHEEFYYPEQVIKPVFADVLPLETPDPAHPNMKYITTLPLVDDGSERATALKNGDPLYAVDEVASDDSDGEPPKRKVPSSASLDLLATSKGYETGEFTYTDESGATQTDTGLIEQGDTDEPGIWDYGFGSILQYDAQEKDKYIQCQYNSFEIHIHAKSTEEVWDDALDDYVEQEVQTCTGEIVTIPVTADDTFDTLKEKIDAYNTDDCAVADCPTDAALALMSNTAANQHIEMQLQPEDSTLTATVFKNSILQANFGNNGATTYPIKIPVIVAAATFSGSIRYEYTTQASSSELKQTEKEIMDGHNDDCSVLIVSPALDTPDCTHEEMKAYRSGLVWSLQPSTVPTEYAEPLGFQYLEEYDNHYKIYVPDLVRRDMDFKERVDMKQEGNYSSSLDANKDGELTLMDFLLNLGLLRPYASGSLSAVTGGTGGTGGSATPQPPSADQQSLLEEAGVAGITDVDEQNIMLLAKCIAAEAGPNKLDQLMVAAVVMNRIYDSRFPNTLIGVLTAPGQYASWSNHSIQNRTPSEQMLSSARQVYSGEFAIPSNVVFQKVGKEGLVYMVVDNGLHQRQRCGHHTDGPIRPYRSDGAAGPQPVRYAQSERYRSRHLYKRRQ